MNSILVSAGFLIACAACSYFIVYSFFLIWRYEEPEEVRTLKEIEEDDTTKERSDTNESKKEEFSSALWDTKCITTIYDCKLDLQNWLNNQNGSEVNKIYLQNKTYMFDLKRPRFYQTCYFQTFIDKLWDKGPSMPCINDCYL